MKRFREQNSTGEKFHLNSPILAYLRDSSVEVVDDEDMRSLYSHKWGCIGKGTVSRRMPNRAMLVPPELIAEFQKSQAQTGVQYELGSDTRRYDEKDKRFSSSNAAFSSLQHITKAAKVDVSVDSSHITSSSTASSSLLTQSTIPIESVTSTTLDSKPTHYEDVLTRYAHEFEEIAATQPLPNAFLCASVASAHSHELHPFEITRSFAHYVSSPPPRLRHILPAPAPSPPTVPAQVKSTVTATGTDVSSIATTISIGASVKPIMESDPIRADNVSLSEMSSDVSQAQSFSRPTVPLPQQVQIAHVIFETSIVEPEAAVYALSRSRGRFIVLPSIHSAFTDAKASSSSFNEGGASVPTGLSIERLWRHFCERILNFPARARFYAHARDTGFVVRDGHAFGSDFELYPHGPGISHGTVCVIVMPLGIKKSENSAITETSQKRSDDSTFFPQPTDKRMGVMKNWVQAHAHGRVIGTVRKAFALAYTELLVPPTITRINGGNDINDISDKFYSKEMANILLDPICALGSECEDNEVGTGEKKIEGSIGDLSSKLRFSGALIRVKLHSLSRWQVTLEHNKKKNAAMQQIALAEAAVFASEENFNSNEKDEESSIKNSKLPITKQNQKKNMRKLLADRAKTIQNELETNSSSMTSTILLNQANNRGTKTETSRNLVTLLDLSALIRPLSSPGETLLENITTMIEDEDPVDSPSLEQTEQWKQHKELLHAFKTSTLLGAALHPSVESESVDIPQWYIERSTWVKRKSTDPSPKPHLSL
jgi:hypothetical protein